jgi:hypothetical protein
MTPNNETIQNTREQEVSHGDLTSPWTIAPLETPVKEIQTEEIGIFKELRDLRDKQQLQEYLDMLPKQVDPTFAAARPTMDYL